MTTVLLLSGTAAFADPIRIVTSGSVDAHEGDNTFSLSGAGFHLSGEIPLGGPLSACFPCAPGTAISLTAGGSVGIYGDPATIDGRTFEGFSGFNGGPFLSGSLSFRAGSIIVPEVPLETLAERFIPFSFTGTLAGFDNFERNGPPLFVADLTGAGTARLEFSHHADLGILASRVTYEFAPAPTPEPATMLLVGPALAGIALVRRRRAAASAD